MSAVAIWTIGLTAAYTLWLIFGGRAAVRQVAAGKDGFFVGGRSFSPLTVALCITGLFSGSSYIAIVELSYLTGVSAIWYGVAETIQVILIALLLVKPLREKLVVTVTGIIGDRFGRLAKGIASVITGITFPMYTVATTIAFASALHVVTGLPLASAVIVTALVLLIYLASGGMKSVAFSQTMNVIVITAMFLIGLWAVLTAPGISGLAQYAAQQPAMFDLGNAGVSLIVAWFGTFLVNVPVAQAAFQMSLSARTPEDGQKGLFLAAIIGAPLLILGVVVGLAAAAQVPGAPLAFVAIPQYIVGTLPAWAAAVFIVGLWACALGWAGPCQFSGATSLGRDLGSAINPRATEAQLVRYTRIALVGLTVVMVLFALARTQQAAWWNVLAWTLRNGATFAPVIAVLFWPLATRTAAIWAMLIGFGSGLGWYAGSGFDPGSFLLDIHPVWVGMIGNLATLAIITLVQARWRRTTHGPSQRIGGAAIVAALALTLTTLTAWGWLSDHGLHGLALFLIVITAFTAATQLTVPADMADGDDSVGHPRRSGAGGGTARTRHDGPQESQLSSP